jgi:murein DD-endopeptidase MepM/ murein hydrolase activator NlpD
MLNSRMHKHAPCLLLLLILFFFARPVSAQEQTGPVYIVQSGDSLSSIAARFNISLEDLMKANGIGNPNLLAANQQLIIPGLEGITGILDTEIINFGDSYQSLVRRTQVPELLLKKLNRLVSPSEFYVGASMIIPKQENGNDLSTRLSPTAGESLFELAIKHNIDTWTLTGTNNLAGTWDGLPGDVLYARGASSDQTATGLPSAFISAKIRDLPIKQGGTGVIIVQTLAGVTLSGLLVDHQLHFFPNADGSQVALQGVHALLEPGLYPLKLEATLPDGNTQSYEQMILVISGNYLTGESLPVDPSLIDPIVTEPEQKQLEEITLPSTSTKYWEGQFVSPAIAYADSTYFTSRYGTRRVYIGQGTDLKINWWHTGLDFGGGTGLPITAPGRGLVVFAGPWIVRGNTTIIDHGWGVYSGFWHQSKINVQVGDIVEQGQAIGEVGGTGRVTGPHLHWELWVNGIQVDPFDWLTQTYP